MPIGNKWVAQINRLLVLVCVVLVLGGCVQSSGGASWKSELYNDHDLVGQIWSSASGSFVSESELDDAASGARYLLLGEKHDNPDHHDLQLRLLQNSLDSNAVGRVVFEMLDSDSDDLLASIYDQIFDDLDAIKNYLNWDEEGWDWEFYGPLVAAAHSREVPIAAGNISGAKVGQVYGADPSEFQYLAAVLDENTMTQLNRDIDESHCGMLPESQFPAMVRVQQVRDYEMANAMTQNKSPSKTVLIAGNYHVRQDLGVPNYLLAQDENLQRDEIVSIAFLEVQPGENRPQEYLRMFGNVAAYDYIWFTPAISNEDYCASLMSP